MSKPVYGIFEGGGAKGIGHIAALKAAEDTGLEFIGVAGASAGALISALIAVGYKADELFDPNAPLNNILTKYGVTPLSLLGSQEWETFEKAQRNAESAAKWGIRLGSFAAYLASPSAVRVAQEFDPQVAISLTEKVRDELNSYLRKKLLGYRMAKGDYTDVPKRIRFRDIDPELVKKCCSLKVIVTDVTNRRMVTFSNAPEFADVEVAEAVAASIAIPLFLSRPYFQL